MKSKPEGDPVQAGKSVAEAPPGGNVVRLVPREGRLRGAVRAVGAACREATDTRADQLIQNGPDDDPGPSAA